jgi:hypothetical protein
MNYVKNEADLIRLNNLRVMPIYTLSQLENMGYTAFEIERYCHSRHRLWEQGRQIVKGMHPSIHTVEKSYDHDKMAVVVYDRSGRILAMSNNDDPLVALLDCAKIVNQLDSASEPVNDLVNLFNSMQL